MDAMAVLKSFDPGLTQQFGGEIKRTINPDGSFNVRRTGVPLSSFNSYLFLVDTTWPKFIAVVLALYLFVNLLFAGLFMIFGIENLVGEGVNSGVGPFLSAFFFSVHTLTTVGYGSIYPRGAAANTIAGIEAMVGLAGFALATGLLYARVSRPSAKIVFSEAILIAPYQEVTGLQFRIANERDNILMNVEAKILLMTVERNNGELRRKFADLPLERANVYFFPLTWTVVHPIDSESPLFGKTAADLENWEAEFLVLVKGFDETFSQTVHARYSYQYRQVEWGSKFLPAFQVDPTGMLVLEMDRVSQRRPVAS